MSWPVRSRRMPEPMSTDIIVSYDGTTNDDDALALGKALARGGASLALAYVRHSREFDPRREELADHDAQRRLESGANWLGDPEIPRHIVFSASTGEGLAQLAQSEGASLIVFGSDYRTPPGRAEPGQTAQYLLEGGSTAIAVAQAGLRTNSEAAIASISTAGSDEDDAAQQTAQSLAQQLGAKMLGNGAAPADIIIVASRAGGQDRRITLGGSTRSMLNSALGSVIVLPRGTPLTF
jgi:nucleotide-binding universal stress UspA family protein